jgi:nucleotide-binding universal stress UspA family protein
MYRHLVLANPGSINAQGALEPALALAAAFGAKLTMLVVERPPRFALFLKDIDDACAAIDTRSNFIIAHAQERAVSLDIGFDARRVVGDLAPCVLRFLAQTPADLLVIGSKGATLASSVSGAGRLFREVPCALHVVRPR